MNDTVTCFIDLGSQYVYMNQWEDVRMYVYTVHVCTVKPSNGGHFGDGINSADFSFVERLSSLGGSKCFVGTILGP